MKGYAIGAQSGPKNGKVSAYDKMKPKILKSGAIKEGSTSDNKKMYKSSTKGMSSSKKGGMSY